MPSQTFPCRDGRYVHITAANDLDFVKICKVMGRPDFPEDPRYATIESRKLHQQPIEQLITDWTMGLNSEEVERLLLA